MSDYGYTPAGRAPMPPGQSMPATTLDVGDAFQTAARTLGANFGPFMLVVAAFALPGFVLDIVFGLGGAAQQEAIRSAQASGDPAAILRAIPMGWFLKAMLGWFVQLILLYIAMGALTHGSVEHLSGKRSSIRSMLSRTASSSLSLSGIAFALASLIFTASIPGFIVGFVAGVGGTLAGAGNEALAGLGALCCMCGCGTPSVLAPVLLVVVVFALAVPASVSEGVGVASAMQRSMDLSRGNRINMTIVLGLALLALIFLYVFRLCVMGGASLGDFDTTTMTARPPSVGTIVLNAFLGFVQSVLAMLSLGTLSAVMYARLRGIKDGVDAAAIADVFR